ncbi:MAG: helix-turn-helix domain-containing protein [Mycobacteriaceae bacterium]|nr:helix-turn-helix domain-containing protein [Mycobacteriaceae bacterium]
MDARHESFWRFANSHLASGRGIRALRLEQCRRELADPGHDLRPVHGIGARWGFSDGPHFTRAFRAVFGRTPAEYRRARDGSAAFGEEGDNGSLRVQREQ